MNEMKATTSMPARRGLVCVECGAPVPLLVRDYGKGSIRLAICGVCNQVADKYVEYETVLLFLEVLLLKPQVYRHVLYNLPAPMETVAWRFGFRGIATGYMHPNAMATDNRSARSSSSA